MRRSLVALSLLPFLTACATGPGVPSPAAGSDGPSLTLPLMPAAISETSLSGQDEGRGTPPTTLPLGLGFTAGPSTVLVGAGLDFPMDDHLTFGPAVQYGFDDDLSLFTAFAQGKYWLPGTLHGDSGEPRLLPYIQVGAGIGYINPDRASSDSGFLLNGGAGFRFLTGQKYRVGTEALLNWAPDKIAGERSWFSWEILQINFEF